MVQPLEKFSLSKSECHEDVVAGAATERRPPQRERDHIQPFSLIHSIPLIHHSSIAGRVSLRVPSGESARCRNLTCMAKRQTVSFVDDLDGSELELDQAHTVSWAWSGVDYRVDVSTSNLDKIENGRVPLAKLLAASTRVGGRRQSTAPKISTSRTAKATTEAEPSRPSTREIRQWAQQAGYEVPQRGKLPRAILDAYAAAN